MNDPYLKRADSGVWYVHWTVNRIGKRVSTRTTDQAKATAFMSGWLLGKPPGADPADLLLSEVWKVYRQKHRLVSESGADIAWKNLDGAFGWMLASALSQRAIDDYVAQRVRGQIGRRVQPQTAAKELSYLLAAIKFCADPRRGVLPQTSVRKFDLPPPGEPRERWLTKAEIAKLTAAAAQISGRGELFLHLALETAARLQALLDLTWDRVDFETGMISLNVPGRARTKKRRADVPISNALRPILERAYAERTNDRVLTHGGPIWQTLQDIAVAAGMAPKPEPGKRATATGISPHVLRHTAATHMARRGVSLFMIAKILGNTVAVVEKTYAKFSPGDLKRAVDQISGE